MAVNTKKRREKQDKTKLIAEVLGIVEEKGKTKDWLLEEIKRQHLPLNISPTANSYEILRSCPKRFISYIYNLLRDDFVIEDVRTSTKTLHWFFTDIVGSSDPKIPVKIQARKINLLNSLIKKAETFQQRDPNTSYIQSTGDGMAIGFSDSPEKPLRLAIELHRSLFKYNKTRPEKDKVYLRIGIDTGPVYFIKDVEDNETVWGPGIIMTRRVMDLCGNNQIFASRRIGEDISRLSSEYKAIMHPIGDYSIKHGEQLLMYNIYGKNFGKKNATKKNKVKEEITEDPLSSQPAFEFVNVEVRLEVIEPKTMMTHHTWIWEIKNITKKPLEQIYYHLDGDIPKEFSDLNLKIIDGNNEKVELLSLDSNKEHEKKFNVRLNKPIKRNQRSIIKLEYDWEEPYKSFEYWFAAKCKKFRYVLRVPKSLQIKNRVLQVVRELGIKKRAEPASKIVDYPDVTEVIWENDKKHIINRHDTFEFQW